MAILQEKIGITNEDLRKIRSMRPGRPVDLQLTTPSTTKRVRSEFVGMDGTRCLVVKFPDEGKWGSLGDAIFKDKSMVVRYILEDDTGEIIAFKVKVVLILIKPSHLIFTSFPLAIQSQDLRTTPRAKTRIATTLKDAETNAMICDSMVVDLSIQGCRLSIGKQSKTRSPKLRQLIKMYLLASDDEKIYLTGTVMNRKADEVNLYYGVKFDSPVEKVSQLLRDIILTIN
jgi:hypothetical protein